MRIQFVIVTLAELAISSCFIGHTLGVSVGIGAFLMGMTIMYNKKP